MKYMSVEYMLVKCVFKFYSWAVCLFNSELQCPVQGLSTGLAMAQHLTFLNAFFYPSVTLYAFSSI